MFKNFPYKQNQKRQLPTPAPIDASGQNFPSPPTVAKSLTSTNSPKKNSELVDNSGLFANNTKLTKSDSPIDVSNKNNKN